MERAKRLLLAVGDDAIESDIRKIKDVEVIDSDQDIDIITDVLNYETADFVILNTVLSEGKSLDLAKQTKEKSVKVIAIIESLKDKEFIAALVGLGVRAFVQFDEIKKIAGYIKDYPGEFDFAKFEGCSSDSGTTTAGIRGRLLRIGSKGSGIKGKNAAMASSGSRIIGVISAFPGAGGTSLCVGLTAYLSGQGKNILLLDRTDNKNLSSIEIKGLDISCCPLSDVKNFQRYDVIIIDFGRLADIDAEGEIHLKPDMRNEKRLERQFCQNLILVGSSLPWKLPDMAVYINHPVFENLTQNWIFYINGEQNKMFEQFRKAYGDKRAFFISYESADPYEQLQEYMESRRY